VETARSDFERIRSECISLNFLTAGSGASAGKIPQSWRGQWRFSHRLTPPTSRASACTSMAALSGTTEPSSDEHGVRRQAYHRAALLLEHSVEIVHHVTRHRIDVAKRALERIVEGMSTGARGLR
jgi:hypothetical protein